MRSKLMLKLANECKSIQSKVDIKLPEHSTFNIYLAHSFLKFNQATQDKIVNLFEDLMKESYEKSSWGYDKESKLKEFNHSRTRIIVLTKASGSENSKLMIDVSPPACDDIVSFFNFRFETGSNKSESALYVYELHVNPKYQQQGIGTALMNLAVELANKFNMDKIMLTVFRSNQAAVKFYQKLKYRPDETSPAENEADYKILSIKVKRN